MPNLATVLKEEIRRLARKEVRQELEQTRKLTAQHRRDIADLKRQVQAQARTIAFLQQREKQRLQTRPTEKLAENARFSPARLRSHRERLGLSAGDYAKLVGVSSQSIYLWEQGKSRPRAAQLASLVAVRGIGKREAQRRLEMLDGNS
ncbi:MAG: helix-turn-helix domain-containing protein [Phycisphaeraceae bacterium]